MNRGKALLGAALVGVWLPVQSTAVDAAVRCSQEQLRHHLCESKRVKMGRVASLDQAVEQRRRLRYRKLKLVQRGQVIEIVWRDGAAVTR
jgi:hypothetical protein